MIISRTPFRVSFFGGGTDYPVWFRENGGAVLATTIDKYCYITCRYLPPFFEHKSRIVWSRIESVTEVDQIQHPSVREALTYLGIHEGVEIHHDGDLPARTGLGSSSSFTVGLLHSLYGLQGVMPSKRQLAMEAIEIEQQRLKENVGCQDQVSAALGGFNKIVFGTDGDFDVHPVILQSDRLEQLQSSLMLFFTGISRTASEVAGEQIRATPGKAVELRTMHQLVYEAISLLCSDADLSEFGRLLHESWKLKSSLTERISTSRIDDMYETALRAGAVGGKLLGAGGGGFMVLFVRPDDRPRVREALKDLLYVPFAFESTGSQVIFYDPQPGGTKQAQAAERGRAGRSQPVTPIRQQEV